MSRSRYIVALATAILCAAAALVVLIGFGAGHRARGAAERMQSFEWIHNDRCLEKVNALPPPEAGFRFAVLGDIQIGTARLPGIVRALEKERPLDFAVQVGDIVVNPDPGHYNLLLSALERSRLGLPMFVVRGNHDAGGSHGDLFGHYFGPKQLWFEYGGALFVLLDNSLDLLSDEDYDWLDEALGQRGAADRPAFLFMHRQPIHWEGDGERPVEHDYIRLFELLAKHRVDYVFAGNWHGYHREERDGTVFVVNGRGGSGGKLVPCYLTMIDVINNNVSDRVIVLPPRAGVVARSHIDDFFIAHIGELVIRRWRLASVAFLLSVAACISLLGLVRRASSRSGPDDIDEG